MQFGKPPEPTVKRTSAYAPGPKQAKIGDLKRVVPLDEVMRIGAKLREARTEHSDISNETVEDLLTQLKKFPLTTDMLMKTKIGRVVNKLKSHNASGVRAVAKDLVMQWTALIDQKERPKIEVKSAVPLNQTRNRRDRQQAIDAITARMEMQEGRAASDLHASSSASTGGGEPATDGASYGGTDEAPPDPRRLSSSSPRVAAAVVVEDQLYAHSDFKIGKHYNRFLAALMREFDSKKFLTRAIQAQIKTGNVKKLRKLFGKPTYS